jgi:acetyl esterase/lipase
MHAPPVSVIPHAVRSPIRLTWTLLTLAAAAAATPAVPSTGDALRLWPHRAPRAATTAPAEVPTLTCFPPASGTANGTAVVICPGGGYSHLSPVREGSDVAQWLAGHGVYAAVLAYRVNAPQPAPMLDGQRAVRTLRFHAKDWGIDRHRIGIMGFSAGGHVASTVGTHYDTGIPGTGDPVQDESCRPDFMLLIYPVVTMRQGITHPGSRHVLLGDQPPQKLVDLYSNETQVTADTPPAFIAASRTDKTVPVKNSELLADALRTRRVPVQLLEFPTGGHGYGMALTAPELNWTDPCLAWMKGRGLLAAAATQPK